MKKEYLIVIAIALLLAGVLLLNKEPSGTPAEQPEATTEKVEDVVETTTPVEEVETPVETEEETDEIQVTYTDNGFSPKEITIKVGDSVVFINNSSKKMWVASNIHPTHKLLPEFDQLTGVETGGEYEFAFDKSGTWAYHNHLGSSHIGTIIVE